MREKMVTQEECRRWRKNTEKYLFLLKLLEKKYKNGEVTIRQKRIIEKKLDLLYEINHWKLNPFIKELPALKEASTYFAKISIKESYEDLLKEIKSKI